MPKSSQRLQSGSDIELDLDAQIAAGLRAFFRIADAWGLTYAEASRLLGQPSKATFYKWKAGNVARIAYGYDLASRLSLVLGIYKALEIIYSDAELAERWVRAPNLAFGGQAALDRMTAGQITDLAAVRSYLDTVRGGR